jgi:hypothetical protein
MSFTYTTTQSRHKVIANRSKVWEELVYFSILCQNSITEWDSSQTMRLAPIREIPASKLGQGIAYSD